MTLFSHLHKKFHLSNQIFDIHFGKKCCHISYFFTLYDIMIFSGQPTNPHGPAIQKLGGSDTPNPKD